MKNIKIKEFLPPLVLLILSLFTWRHIPFIQFQGEGFYYFAKSGNFSLNKDLLSHHDAFALWSFNILSSLFQDKIILYMWFLLFIMLLIDLVMYIFVRVITGSKLAAFLAALLFSLSYIGKYDMYSIGGYQYFLQRAVVLLPHLLALMFLILYFLRNFSIKYYIFSLSLYLLGIMMGFFGTWFLPPFLSFPLFYLIFQLQNFKRIFLKTFWTPFPFLIGNILIIRNSSYFTSNEETFLYFFLHRPGLISGVIQQLDVMTFPLVKYEDLVKYLSPESLFGKDFSLFIIRLSILVIYALAFLVIWKLFPLGKVLAATAIASMISMLLFNMYLNAATVLFTLGSSRYFYFPFAMIALFWGLFFAGIFSKKNFLPIYLFPIFCIMWIIYNNNAIQKNLKLDEWYHTSNRETIRILRSWSSKLKANPSYVMLPSNLGAYGGEFAFRYYSHPDGRFELQGFESLDFNDLASKNFDPERLYVLRFDNSQQTVIDETEKSRAILRKLEKRK